MHHPIQQRRYGNGFRAAFTLIELLVVIAIVGLLAALIFPSFSQARARARQATCSNNLRQLSMAVTMYREDHNDLPYWLSTLYDRYIKSTESFLCPSDPSRGGDGSKPNLPIGLVGEQYPSADDPGLPSGCSYLYEFNGNTCEWYGGAGFLRVDPPEGTELSWKNIKIYQMRYGDLFRNGAWTETGFPMIRCFHHVTERQVRAQELSNTTGEPTGNILSVGMTINVAYGGNIFVAPTQWEFPMVD